MISREVKIPFYAKATILVVGLLALVTVLHFARGIIVPLVLAVIIAIVLQPVVNWFVRLRINRVLSIVITLSLGFVIIALFGTIVVSEASRLSESWPTLVDKFTAVLNHTITRASGMFDINPQDFHLWITKTKSELINTSSAAIGQTLVRVGSGVVMLLLVPVYVFMLLLYEPLLLEFIRKLFGIGNRERVSQIVAQTKTVIQRYLIGLLIEVLIIASLYSATLLIFGIEYAILLGIIGALLNVIPYVGGLVGVALPMIIALATKSSAWYAIYVLAVYYFIQLIDNNYIVPKIVASKVKINALFSLMAVIVGNALWGIPGMFLAIPLLAIVKLVLDSIEPLAHWGCLLGDAMPPIFGVKPLLRNKAG